MCLTLKIIYILIVNKVTFSFRVPGHHTDMIMRNCCCCRVTSGSVILGLLTLISSVITLIPLLGYFLDIPYINIIKDQQILIEYNIQGERERLKM